MSVPKIGAVLGVDVGFSPRRKSSAVCRLDWNEDTASWTIARFRATEPERADALARLAGGPLSAAAFDGPLRRGFEAIGVYRTAERMLTSRLQPHIGKPGTSNAPVGRALNEATNACARIVKRWGTVAKATHAEAIDDAAIVETFPNAFLGLMIEEPASVPAKRSNRSDSYYSHLEKTGGLARIFERLLPGRKLSQDFGAVKNHDDRASLACALAALCVVTNDYVAVGDSGNGWIILPPHELIWPSSMQLLRLNAGERLGHLSVSGRTA